MLSVNNIQNYKYYYPAFRTNEKVNHTNKENKDNNNNKLLLSLIGIGLVAAGIIGKHQYNKKFEEKMMEQTRIFSNSMAIRETEYEGLFDYYKDYDYLSDAVSYSKHSLKMKRLDNLRKLNEDISFGQVMLMQLKKDKKQFLKSASPELREAIEKDKDFIKASRIYRKRIIY